MASTTPNTILLGAEDSNRARRNNAQANGAIVPGDLIQRDSIQSGGAKPLFEVTAHSAAEKTAPLVALEYAKTGRGIDDAYADGDHVEYWVAQPGDRLYMRLADGDTLTTAAHATVTVGDTLGSAGAEVPGTLKAVVTAGEEMFEALEDVDAALETAPVRLRVEAI